MQFNIIATWIREGITGQVHMILAIMMGLVVFLTVLKHYKDKVIEVVIMDVLYAQLQNLNKIT